MQPTASWQNFAVSRMSLNRPRGRAPLTSLFSADCAHSRPISASMCIWKMTFYFHAQLRWKPR